MLINIVREEVIGEMAKVRKSVSSRVFGSRDQVGRYLAEFAGITKRRQIMDFGGSSSLRRRFKGVSLMRIKESEKILPII